MGRYESAAEYLSWTSPAEVVSALNRRWSRGDLLSTYVTGEELFPMSVALRRPSPALVRSRPAEVHRWIRVLEDESRPRRGFGYEIVWTETVEARTGALVRLPASLIIPSAADALHLIDKAAQAELFASLVRRTLETCPGLRTWLSSNGLRAVRCAQQWDRLLRVVAWFQAHPRPNVYLRQIDLEDVDFTFILQQRRLIGELLNEVLPRGAIDPSATAVRAFERRFGLLSAPPTVRIRLLDHKQTVGGFRHIGVPIPELMSTPLSASHVFITESEMTALAFPERDNSLAIFDLGNNERHLADVSWLRKCTVYYWGSIDVQGFARLDRVRSVLPDVRSFLMDRATFVAHNHSWTPGEATRLRATSFEYLTSEEQSFLTDLVDGRFGSHARLEQDRVSYRWLQRALAELPAA